MKQFSLIALAVMLIWFHSVLGETDTAKEWLERSQDYYYEGDYAIALSCIDRSIDVNSSNYNAWYYKGAILEDMGKYNEAIACYDKTITINPLASNAWQKKGRILEEQHRYKEALDCYIAITAIKKSGDQKYITLMIEVECFFN